MIDQTREVKGLYKQALNAKKYTVFFNSLYEELISELISRTMCLTSLVNFKILSWVNTLIQGPNHMYFNFCHEAISSEIIIIILVYSRS